MNCKKCNIDTDGDIFCSNCSNEILKLYVIDKVPADEIEKRFSLLPNTVNYWYNYCKGKNGDNFSYLIVDNRTQETTTQETTSNINIEDSFTQDNSKNDNSKNDNSKNDNIKRGIFTVLTFILVNISMFIPYIFAFWLMFAGAMGTVQGEGLLLPIIIMSFSVGIVFGCLKFSHFILNKLKIMENFLIEKLYKGLCNVLCGYIALSVLSATLYSNPIHFISSLISNVTQGVQTTSNSNKIDNEIPFYSFDNYWQYIDMYFVNEKVYVSYNDTYDNDIVVNIPVVSNKNITINENSIEIDTGISHNTVLDKVFMIKDGAGEGVYMQIYTNKFASELYFNPENTEKFYSLDTWYIDLKNKNSAGDFINLSKMIYENFGTGPVSTVAGSDIVIKNMPSFIISPSEKGFGMIDVIPQGYVPTDTTRCGLKFDYSDDGSATLLSQASDIVPNTAGEYDITKGLDHCFKSGSRDEIYLYVDIYSADSTIGYVQCSNKILVTKEQYENKSW